MAASPAPVVGCRGHAAPIAWHAGVELEGQRAADARPIPAQLAGNVTREFFERETVRWREESRRLAAEVARLQAELDEAARAAGSWQAHAERTGAALQRAGLRIQELELQAQDACNARAAAENTLQGHIQLNARLRDEGTAWRQRAEELHAEVAEVRRGEALRAEQAADRERAGERLAAAVALVPGAARQEVAEAARTANSEAAAFWTSQAEQRVQAAEERLGRHEAGLVASLVAARADCGRLGQESRAATEARCEAERGAGIWRERAQAASTVAFLAEQHEAAQAHLVRSEGLRAANFWAYSEQLEARLDHLTKERDKSDAVGKDLRKWVVASVNEVNRSAHGPRDPFAPEEKPGGAGRAWVDMLAKFGREQQLRTGHGCRTR